MLCIFFAKAVSENKQVDESDLENSVGCHLKKTEKYFLVVCAVFQDEAFFLKEWITFHSLMGVEHFYLYNNSSTDNDLEVLDPYIQKGIVELIDWPIHTHNQEHYLTLLQLPAYNHALNTVKHTAHWAAFIDLDEFLCPMHHETIAEMLKEYEDCAGLAINWQTFGTSGIDKLDDHQLLLENFLWKAPSWWEINKHIKMLVKPACVHSFSHNPHYCQFKPSYFAVNSDKTPLLDLCETQPILIDTIRINHYWFGDRDWFINNKLPRRKKWGIFINPDYLDSFIDSFNQEKDESMLRFIPKIKTSWNSID